MPSPSRKCWTLAVAMLLTTVAYAGDTILATATATRFPGDEYAYGGTLTWQHAGSFGGTLLGLTSTEYPIGSLTNVDFDAYQAPSSSFTLIEGATLGDAATASHDGVLYKARFMLNARIDDAWSARIGDQFIELGAIHGQTLSVGTEYRPVPLLGLSVAGGWAPQGTAYGWYGTLSFQSYGPYLVSGGLIYGRTGYDPAEQAQVSYIRRLIQAYVGTSIPLPGGRLTVGADVVDFGGALRETLRLGFVRPIR